MVKLEPAYIVTVALFLWQIHLCSAASGNIDLSKRASLLPTRRHEMVRRTHKKSRGGCTECKRRHIKVPYAPTEVIPFEDDI